MASFSVMTWNIWFGNVQYEARMKEIFRQCSDLKPDVIAFRTELPPHSTLGSHSEAEVCRSRSLYTNILETDTLANSAVEKYGVDGLCLCVLDLDAEEVIPPFVRALQNEPWAAEYSQSDTDGRTVDPYGVLLLSRLPSRMAMHKLPSRMGRSLLTADIDLGQGQGSFTVGTVHLESLNSAPTREEQLKISADVLRGKENALLVGDFNFCSYRSWVEGKKLGKEGRASKSPLENDALCRHLGDFQDTWSLLRPDDKGYTFDSTRNGVIKQYEQMRYDRVMARLGGGWRAASIDLLGTEAIQGEEAWLRPSDHFGLIARFELQQQGGVAEEGGAAAGGEL